MAIAETAAAVPDDDGIPDSGKSKRGRRRLIGLAAVAVLVLGGGGAYLAGLFSGGDDASAEGGHGAPAPAYFHDLPEMLVTISSGERRSSYLKVRVTLELADPVHVERIQQMSPRIVDYCQVYLRELRPEDIKGSAGSARLHTDLLRRINLAVAPVQVKDVLLAELFIQ